MKKLLLLAFLAIFFSCKKNILDDEQSLKHIELETRYSNAFKKNLTPVLKLLRPDLLEFDKAVEIKSTILGKGFLIPLGIKINHSFAINIFAFYNEESNQIYQITTIMNVFERKHIIDYLENDRKVVDLQLTILDKLGNLMEETKGESLMTTQELNQKTVSSYKKVNHVGIETMSSCSQENTYYLVRTFYDPYTGEVLDQVVVAIFCVTNEPQTGGGSGTIISSDTLELYKAIINSTCFTSAQENDFRIMFNSWYDEDCVNRAIFKDLVEKGVKLDFCLDANFSDNAFYSSILKKIVFKNEYSLRSSSIFDHEIFHAFQDAYYSGGTQQYNRNAKGNIEFEAQLNFDISRGPHFHSFSFGNQTTDFEYFDWLDAITEGFTKIPSSPLDLNIPGHPSYEYFLERYSVLKRISYTFGFQPEGIFYLSTKNVTPNCTN